MDKGRGPCRRRFPRKRLCLSRSDRFSLQVYTQWPRNATAAPLFFKILSLPSPLSPLRSFCSASFSPFLSRSFSAPFPALFMLCSVPCVCSPSIPLLFPFSLSHCLPDLSVLLRFPPHPCAFLSFPVSARILSQPPAFFGGRIVKAAARFPNRMNI